MCEKKINRFERDICRECQEELANKYRHITEEHLEPALREKHTEYLRDIIKQNLEKLSQFVLP